MNVLVINGSPKGEKSDCLKITRAFISGLEEKSSTPVITTYTHLSQLTILDCKGCHCCWGPTPGFCCQKDDMSALLDRICDSDLVIWSTPLYSYSFPSKMKAVIDRLMPLSCPTQVAYSNGEVHHEFRGKFHGTNMLISGCGFPQIEKNYEGMVFQFERGFGATSPRILCMEAPLLGIEQAAPLAQKYLALAREAGSCYASTGLISEELMDQLSQPMFDPDTYRKMAGR